MRRPDRQQGATLGLDEGTPDSAELGPYRSYPKDQAGGQEEPAEQGVGRAQERDGIARAEARRGAWEAGPADPRQRGPGVSPSKEDGIARPTIRWAAGLWNEEIVAQPTLPESTQRRVLEGLVYLERVIVCLSATRPPRSDDCVREMMLPAVDRMWTAERTADGKSVVLRCRSNCLRIRRPWDVSRHPATARSGRCSPSCVRPRALPWCISGATSTAALPRRCRPSLPACWTLHPASPSHPTRPAVSHGGAHLRCLAAWPWPLS